MIGQTKLLARIEKMLENDKFPKFIVLAGLKGSGKTTLSKIIAEKLNAEFSICGIKVDEIREVINTAYTVRDKVLYCIKDADTMRNEAKNAMLKITEEPPKNAYFILTVEHESTLLDTIKSRAFVMYMEEYSHQDIIDYATFTKQPIIPYGDIASTPYELDILNSYGSEFIEYVNLVIDNIGDVEPANAFKSSTKLALKDEEDKYDVKMFLQTVMKLTLDKSVELANRKDYAGMTKYLDTLIHATFPALNDVSKLGINKVQLYDTWVFNIREALNK